MEKPGPVWLYVAGGGLTDWLPGGGGGRRPDEGGPVGLYETGGRPCPPGGGAEPVWPGGTVSVVTEPEGWVGGAVSL